MAKEASHNPELTPATTIFREVLVSVQNSSNATLVLTTFALTSGQWDPSAPNGLPTQGYQFQASTPVWGNLTPAAFTSVSGQMTFQGNTALVTVTWTWNYGSSPTANVTVTGTTLTATVTLANQTTNTVTAQVVITGNA